MFPEVIVRRCRGEYLNRTNRGKRKTWGFIKYPGQSGLSQGFSSLKE